MNLHGHDITYDAAGEYAAIRDAGCEEFRDEAIANLAEAFDANKEYAQCEYLDADAHIKLIADARTSDDFAELGRRLHALAVSGFADFLHATLVDECERLYDKAVEQGERDMDEARADAWDARCDSESDR